MTTSNLILVVWPKSAILKMGPKGLSQGPINGDFFWVSPDMFLDLCAKFYFYMIFYRFSRNSTILLVQIEAILNFATYVMESKFLDKLYYPRQLLGQKYPP